MSSTNVKQAEEFKIPDGSLIKKMKYIIAFIGPASIITSTAMGAGTASSCVQAGALFGYDLLWVILLSGLMCGGVSFIGAKATSITGMNVFDLIEFKMGKVFAKILFGIVLCTWLMVLYSQGATMKHLNDVLFGEGLSPYTFTLTILIIGFIYTTGSNNRVLKIASVMCTLMAAIYFINVFYVKPDLGELAKGIIPGIPTAAQAAIVAGVIGGSGPGTSALWNSYSVKAQKWDKPSCISFIAWDQFIFAIIFTIFSLGIFLSGAAVLYPAGIKVTSALDAAKAIEPIAGAAGKYIFALGLWGAVFTTIGGMSTLASYAMNSLLRISENNSDKKVRRLIYIGIVLTLISGTIKVNVMALLVNFIGLLNIGGFVIILLLTYFTSSEKHAGAYKNKWYIKLLGIIICCFNFYAVITYILRFI